MIIQSGGCKGHELELSGSGYGYVTDCCERGNKPTNFTKNVKKLTTS